MEENPYRPPLQAKLVEPDDLHSDLKEILIGLLLGLSFAIVGLALLCGFCYVVYCLARPWL